MVVMVSFSITQFNMGSKIREEGMGQWQFFLMKTIADFCLILALSP
jgi:hypothetical protein